MFAHPVLEVGAEHERERRACPSRPRPGSARGSRTNHRRTGGRTRARPVRRPSAAAPMRRYCGRRPDRPPRTCRRKRARAARVGKRRRLRHPRAPPRGEARLGETVGDASSATTRSAWRPSRRAGATRAAPRAGRCSSARGGDRGGDLLDLGIRQRAAVEEQAPVADDADDRRLAEPKGSRQRLLDGARETRQLRER